LVQCWLTEPDYSHGLLSPAIVFCALFFRRGSLPVSRAPQPAWGLALLSLAFTFRLIGAIGFLDALDNWSLVLWLAGVITLWAGLPMLRWTSPALAFVLLAMPLPFNVEHLCSAPLQGAAVRGSTWTLQTLGAPAFAEGRTIILGEHRLEVAQACAGLRIFMGMLALALTWALVSTRPKLQRALLFCCAVPAAVVANIARIVLTGLCLAYLPQALAQTLVHDVAGWLMIPLAVGCLALAQAWLSRVIVVAPPVSSSAPSLKHRLSLQ
jgi:exosortase